MPPKRRSAHPEDAVLVTLADDEAAAPATARAHVASCSACAARIAVLRETRSLLQKAAALEQSPRRDLAQTAVARLRGRRTAIGSVNEVFEAFKALIRGFADLLAPHEEESRRG